jgi:hypothetical protein
MSPSAAGEVCARPGRLQAIPGGSSYAPRRGSAGGPRRSNAEGKKEEKRERERAQKCAPRGLRAGGLEPTGPRRPTHQASVPRAERPVGRRAPETLAHGRSGDRGGRSCPACRLPLAAHSLPRPSSGPRAQLTGGGDRNRNGESPTWPCAEQCAPNGKEERVGGVGVPAGKGQLGCDD